MALLSGPKADDKKKAVFPGFFGIVFCCSRGGDDGGGGYGNAERPRMTRERRVGYGEEIVFGMDALVVRANME